MFNKNNTKIKPESEFLASAKFHTMKNDLAGENDALPSSRIKTDEKPKDLPEVKGGSPFLNSTAPSVKKPESAKNKIENVPEKEVKKTGFPNFERINEENNVSKPNKGDAYEFFEQSGDKGHAFLYVLILLLILLLGGGGYYFWFIRGEKNVNEIFTYLIEKKNSLYSNDATDNGDTNSGAINDLSENKDGFSDKVNFMVIKDENLDQAGIKTVIDDKFVEMEKHNGTQVEFLIVDQNNKPLPFKDFIDNLEIILSPEILNNIEGENFSLFLYRNNDLKRLNLVVSVKNEDLLRMSLAKSEKTLVDNLKSLFMYAQPDSMAKKQFSESNYNGYLVRYINLNTNPDLSLDYAIVGNYLVIATNKESGRLIMDKLSNESVPKKDLFTPEN